MQGIARPWHVGVLWDRDPRLPAPLLAALSSVDGLVVGDNEPYSGKAPQDYTVDNHAEANGLPHLGIEIRQDLIDDMAGVERIAAVMHKTIESIPERIGLNRPRASA